MTERPTLEQVDSAIAALKQADLRAMELADVKVILQPLTLQIRMRSPLLNKGARLFRARQFASGERPILLADISFPPPERVRSYQRVNPPGRPVFYCSESFDVSLSEVGAATGSVVAVSEWQVERQLHFTDVGFSENCLQTLTGRPAEMPAWATEPLPHELPPLDKEEDAVNRRVVEFLAEQFCVQVRSGDEHLYKVSVAISEVLGFDPASTGRFEAVGNDIGTNVGGSGFDGITYPSVSCRAPVQNVALRPHSVDSKLRFLNVGLVRVTHADKSDMKFEEIDFANSATVAREIEWKGRAGVFRTKKPGDTFRLTQTGVDRWSITDIDGNRVDRE